MEGQGTGRRYSRDHLLSGNDDMYSLESKLVNIAERELYDGDVKDPIHKLRLVCMTRGANGILALARAFRAMDDDGSKTLNEEEFITGIKNCGLNLSDDEVRNMFQAFDEDGSGNISMTEFLLKLRPPLSQRRLHNIDQAFAKMDKTNDGVITIEDLKNVYSVKDHSMYVSGERSKEEILKDFLKNFEGGHGNHDGKVTKEEFTNYYAAISASIDDDMFFDLMMRRAYNF